MFIGQALDSSYVGCEEPFYLGPPHSVSCGRPSMAVETRAATAKGIAACWKRQAQIFFLPRKPHSEVLSSTVFIKGLQMVMGEENNSAPSTLHCDG